MDNPINSQSTKYSNPVGALIPICRAPKIKTNGQVKESKKEVKEEERSHVDQPINAEATGESYMDFKK